jgi:hypothetical protein
VKRLAILLLLIAAPAAARDTIGVYRGWGAFRDARPERCYAIARPVVASGRPEGFASIASWPARRLRASLHIHLSRPRASSAGVTLSIGERRFTLSADARDAFAPDTPTDRAIVTAMREGRSMSIEAIADTGRPFADVYTLAGAATAMDAATLACMPQG